MTTPIHRGMPCDPLTVDEEPRILAHVDGPRTTCPDCGMAMLGRGTIEHAGEGAHWYTPEPKPRRSHAREWLVFAIVLILAWAVVAVVTEAPR